jgi:hypothetical protein
MQSGWCVMSSAGRRDRRQRGRIWAQRSRGRGFSRACRPHRAGSERAKTAGGGLRTAEVTLPGYEVTLPGYRHDFCSAIHPAALASSFFRACELTRRVRFVAPDISYAHPLDEGAAGLAYRRVDRTTDGRGIDGRACERLFQPLLNRIEGVVAFTGNQMLRWPDDIRAAVTYAARVLEQGNGVGWPRFRGRVAPALPAGVGGHTWPPGNRRCRRPARSCCSPRTRTRAARGIRSAGRMRARMLTPTTFSPTAVVFSSAPRFVDPLTLRRRV